jgi:hypothetical protein
VWVGSNALLGPKSVVVEDAVEVIHGVFDRTIAFAVAAFSRILMLGLHLYYKEIDKTVKLVMTSLRLISSL